MENNLVSDIKLDIRVVFGFLIRLYVPLYKRKLRKNFYLVVEITKEIVRVS